MAEHNDSHPDINMHRFTDGSSILMKQCATSGFCALIAIDSLQLGPAIGGCRFLEYTSIQSAMMDARALARAMTYKAALHDLPHGGGKAVIIKPPGTYDRKQWLTWFCDILNTHKGNYITSLDSGTSQDDLDVISQHSPYVLGTSYARDIAHATAIGVLSAMKAAVKIKYGLSSLSGMSVAIQGVGNVGLLLGTLLEQEHVKLFIADTQASAVSNALERFTATVVKADSIVSTNCDILAPCALGGVLHDAADISAPIVCGAANNQLSNADTAVQLYNKDILFVPDILASGGGLIFVAAKHAGQTRDQANTRVKQIYQRSMQYLSESINSKQPPYAYIHSMLSNIHNFITPNVPIAHE